MEPCVRTHIATPILVGVRLATLRLANKSGRHCKLRGVVRIERGGVLCRRKGRYPAQNHESGRERPLPKGVSTAWPSANQGRSRPDLSLNLPHEIGPRRPRPLPHSPAPDNDINARLVQPRVMSIAAQGGPAAWH